LEDEEAGEVLKFLLDTNILSEIRKPKPHGGVLAWFTAHQSASFATPAIALFELQMGTEKLRLQDPHRAAAFDFWIGRIAGGSDVLPLDAAAAREAARLLNKHSMVLMADAMIAAIARVNGLTVATRNTRDFQRFAVPLVNPFDHPKG
jgi:predicted nucleic acid-binding protein